MRKLLIVVALGLPSLARAATWTLDTAHTSVQFSVRHLMVSTVRGAFGKLTGTVQVDEKDLTRSKIQATIDAASIDTRIALLDAGEEPGFPRRRQVPDHHLRVEEDRAGGPGSLQGDRRPDPARRHARGEPR